MQNVPPFTGAFYQKLEMDWVWVQ